jgi:hypothetical protein
VRSFRLDPVERLAPKTEELCVSSNCLVETAAPDKIRVGPLEEGELWGVITLLSHCLGAGVNRNHPEEMSLVVFWAGSGPACGKDCHFQGEMLATQLGRCNYLSRHAWRRHLDLALLADWVSVMAGIGEDNNKWR